MCKFYLVIFTLCGVFAACDAPSRNQGTEEKSTINGEGSPDTIQTNTSDTPQPGSSIPSIGTNVRPTQTYCQGKERLCPANTSCWSGTCVPDHSKELGEQCEQHVQCQSNWCYEQLCTKTERAKLLSYVPSGDRNYADAYGDTKAGDQQIILRFSAPMDPTSFFQNIRLNGQLFPDKSIGVYDHSASAGQDEYHTISVALPVLANGTSYQVAFDHEVLDRAGNALTISPWSFSTVSQDIGIAQVTFSPITSDSSHAADIIWHPGDTTSLNVPLSTYAVRVQVVPHHARALTFVASPSGEADQPDIIPLRLLDNLIHVRVRAEDFRVEKNHDFRIQRGQMLVVEAPNGEIEFGRQVAIENNHLLVASQANVFAYDINGENVSAPWDICGIKDKGVSICGTDLETRSIASLGLNNNVVVITSHNRNDNSIATYSNKLLASAELNFDNHSGIFLRKTSPLGLGLVASNFRDFIVANYDSFDPGVTNASGWGVYTGYRSFVPLHTQPASGERYSFHVLAAAISGNSATGSPTQLVALIQGPAGNSVSLFEVGQRGWVLGQNLNNNYDTVRSVAINEETLVLGGQYIKVFQKDLQEKDPQRVWKEDPNFPLQILTICPQMGIALSKKFVAVNCEGVAFFERHDIVHKRSGGGYKSIRDGSSVAVTDSYIVVGSTKDNKVYIYH